MIMGIPCDRLKTNYEHMKKKSINIFLIIAVSGIWVIVIYRVVNRYASASAPVVNQTITEEKIIPVKKTAVPFELIGNYRDPFLGDVPKPEKIKSTGNSEKKESKKTNPPVTDSWPQVKYIGMIKNNDSGKMVALMNIGGKEVRMNPGQDFNGVKLDKMFKDSCLISMNREKKIITKK